VYWSYGTSVAVLFAAAAILYFRPPVALAMLVPLAVAHGMLVNPNGWFPRADEYPIPIEHVEMVSKRGADPQQKALRPRVFSSYQPNQNLIPDFDVVGVFDPVCNAHLCKILREHFHLQHPQFDLHALSGPSEALTLDQLDLLRILGVSRIYDYDVVPEIKLEQNPSGSLRLGWPMPRLWLLAPENANTLDKRFQYGLPRQALKYARRSVLPNASILDVKETQNGYEFTVSQDFEGELVAQQAYAHAWRFEGRSGVPFCDIFPRWSVDLHPGRTYHIEYVPLGFEIGSMISLCGVLLAVVSGLFLLRRI